MPHAVSSFHPFQSTRRDGAVRSGRVLARYPAPQHDREGRDAGMRMDAEEWLTPRRDFGAIQEYEGLDQLADIGRADKPRDGPVTATAGHQRNAAIASA